MSAPPPFGGMPYPQPPFPASPGAPRLRRRRAWLAGTVAAVVTGMLGGVAGYEAGLHHSQIKAANAYAAATAAGCPAGQPAPSATSPAGASLLTRLVPMPAGTTRFGSLRQGALSLDDYISALYPGNRSEQQKITARCFQAVVHREWETSGGTSVSIWLIQFATAADARSYTLSIESADSADPANKVKLTVTGVGDGRYLADPALDHDGNTFTRLLGDRGDVSMIIHVFIPARLGEATAVQVLKAQYARLAS
jgi:hypothetical protein